MNTNLKQISTLRTISIIKYQHRQNCSFTCFQKVLVPIFDGVNTPNLKKFSRLRFLLNVYSLCILRKHGNKNEFVPGSLDEFGTRIYRANLGYLGLYQAISSYHKQSWAISGHHRISLAIFGCLGLSPAIFGHLRLSLAISIKY